MVICYIRNGTYFNISNMKFQLTFRQKSKIIRRTFLEEKMIYECVKLKITIYFNNGNFKLYFKMNNITKIQIFDMRDEKMTCK